MSTIKVGTLLAADGSSTTQPSIPALETRMAKAWVNFNGTGSVAIRKAYNVSSITDTATGIFVVNFTSNLPTAGYAVVGQRQAMASYTNAEVDVYALLVSSFTMTTIENGSARDSSNTMAIVFHD